MYGDGLYGDIVDSYPVVANMSYLGREYSVSATIDLVDLGHEYLYRISLPYSNKVLDEARAYIEAAKRELGYSNDFLRNPIETVLSHLDRAISRVGEEDRIRLGGLREAIKYYLVINYLGYGLVTFPLADENVEDISCISPGREIRVWHKRFNDKGWLKTNIVLSDAELERLIFKFSFRTGRSISLLTPVLEGVLPEGYRVTALYRRELSPMGSNFTIRKFRSKPYTILELVDRGFMNSWLAAVLWRILELKKFMFIIGPSGSGKTTLLNALANLIHPNSKIISIEDIQELHLPYHPGWKPLVTREGGYARDYTIFDLVRIALRERADYILLGESRGEEARLIFQGAATGHGCLTTFHASTLDELIARLVAKPISVDREMLDLIDTVVIVNYERNGGGVVRRVVKVFRYLDGWRSIYSAGVGGEAKIINTRDVSDLGLSTVARHESFLKYLLKLGATSPREFIDRVRMYYDGKYRFRGGNWVLVDVVD